MFYTHIIQILNIWSPRALGSFYVVCNVKITVPLVFKVILAIKFKKIYYLNVLKLKRLIILLNFNYTDF